MKRNKCLASHVGTTFIPAALTPLESSLLSQFQHLLLEQQAVAQENVYAQFLDQI